MIKHTGHLQMKSEPNFIERMKLEIGFLSDSETQEFYFVLWG